MTNGKNPLKQDERRVVYVGRIRRSMTHDELRERFSQFGEVECVSLHFRDRGYVQRMKTLFLLSLHFSLHLSLHQCSNPAPFIPIATIMALSHSTTWKMLLQPLIMAANYGSLMSCRLTSASVVGGSSAVQTTLI